MQLPRCITDIVDVWAQPPEQLVCLKRPVAILTVQQHSRILRNIFYQMLKSI